MNTAVIINLDYENQHSDQCRTLWKIIETRMQCAGFSKSGRRFMTPKNMDTASRMAEAVMDGIDAEYEAAGQKLRPFIRDFYCIPDVTVTDLWSPSVHSIEVSQMESGAFERFFGSPLAVAFAH